MRLKFKTLASKMVYGESSDLMEPTHKKDRDFFIWQLIFQTGFLMLTGGAFLTGFALYLGAGDTLAGYIVLLGSICGIFSIFAGLLLERIERRKKLIIILTIVTRTMVLLVVFIPLFFKGTMAVVMLFAILIVVYILNSFKAIAVNNWFISVVPENIRGRYFAIRQTFALVVAAVLPVLAGRFLDMVSSQYIGFVVIFVFAYMMLIGETISYSKIYEPESGHLGKGQLKLRDIIKIPVKNKEFIRYVLTLVWFFLGLHIAVAYTQVYMIKYLKVSYTFITLMGAGISLMQIFSYRIWGRIFDKKGAQFTMNMAISFFTLEMLVWVFITSTTKYYLIPLAYFIAAIGNPGFAIGSFNLRFQIMPKKGRSLYDGFFIAVIGIAIIIGPYMGRLLQKGIMASEFLMKTPFAQFRMLYLVTVIVLIFLQIYNYCIKDRIS